jgi:hypothetical protein
MTQHRLGQVERARKTYTQACGIMEDSHPRDHQLRLFRDEAASVLGLPNPNGKGDRLR